MKKEKKAKKSEEKQAKRPYQLFINGKKVIVKASSPEDAIKQFNILKKKQ